MIKDKLSLIYINFKNQEVNAPTLLIKSKRNENNKKIYAIYTKHEGTFEKL